MAREILAPTLACEPASVLEPSFGEGAFLIPVIEHFIQREPGSGSAKLGRVLNERVWGVEIDPSMYERALTTIRSRWGPLPSSHNLLLGDYFRFEAGILRFDAIVGNPPFGGTFDPRLEDVLDRRYGRYRGSKVKKETYSFFIAKALDELRHARLGKLSARQREDIRRSEEERRTRRLVVTTRRRVPLRVKLPHPDYRYYNKAASERFYAPPSHAVYWKDEGDAVLTFKKTGPWYLRGVGGGPFFGREGLTWQLVAPRIKARYLPEGYILDSGAPCAFLRDGVSRDELWLILGWLQTPLATSLLKEVINHTRNIQGKDIERLPYPWWVRQTDKRRAAAVTRDAVRRLQAGEQVGVEGVLAELGRLFDPGAADARAAA